MLQGTRNGFSCDGEWYGAKEDARLLHVSGGLKWLLGETFAFLHSRSTSYKALRSEQYLTSLPYMLGVVIAACISLCPLIAAESMELPSLSALSISLQHLNYPDYRPLPCSHSDCYCAAGVLQRASNGEFSAPTLLPGHTHLPPPDANLSFLFLT